MKIDSPCILCKRPGENKSKCIKGCQAIAEFKEISETEYKSAEDVIEITERLNALAKKHLKKIEPNTKKKKPRKKRKYTKREKADEAAGMPLTMTKTQRFAVAFDMWLTDYRVMAWSDLTPDEQQVLCNYHRNKFLEDLKSCEKL